MALDINTAGSDFVKAVLKLYRSQKYFCEKEILVGKLLNSSLELGRLMTEISVCTDDLRKSRYARIAYEELSRAMFTLKVMCDAGIYSNRRAAPVNELGEKIREFLKCYASAPIFQPEPQLRPDNGDRQLSLLPEVIESDGGFDEIYTGKV